MATSAKPAKAKRVKKLRIFLVEDHPVFRDGLANLLNGQEDMAVCGEAKDANQGLKSILKLKPDLAIVDLALPGKSGLDLIREIRSLKVDTKLLVVSMYDEGLYAQRVLRAGGDGYIMKQEDPEEIVHAIRDVLAGHIYVSEEIFEHGIGMRLPEKKDGPLDQLSDSELEVLEALGLGKSPREISLQTGLSAGEVTVHRTSIRRKLGLSNNNALARYAVCWVETSRA